MKAKLSSIVFASVLSLLLFSSSAVEAQGWAIEVGPAYNIQKGTFVAPCGCTFADGYGLGLIGSVSASFFSLGGFSVGLGTGVDVQKFTSHEVDPATLLQYANGDQEEIKLAYVNIDPYIRYQIPGTGLFFQVSPGIDYLVSSSFNHIAGAVAVEDTTISFNPTDAVDIHKASYHAKVSVGYSFGLLGMALEPSIYAKQPLSNLSAAATDEWHVTTLYAALAIRFGL